ncbi:alpha/beta hydrolase fold-domain-containing protein [Aspergillus heterothallicus]
MSRPIHQPIHPSIRPLLDPEYVAFHDAHFQYILPDEQQPWSRSKHISTPLPWPSTAHPLTPVASTRDLTLTLPLENNGTTTTTFPIRIFTPPSPKPSQGYPLFLWFHGGGWALGGLSDGNDLCTMICAVARCVVVSVAYRLAPEHPYPAAITDAVAALQWASSPAGSSTLSTNPAQIAIGGTSAGGNIAAVLSLKASQLTPAFPLRAQILIVPVIDNTATTGTIWAKNQLAPWLTPQRMLWYRAMYLPNNPSDAGDWAASPNLAPRALLAKTPRTWIAVSGCDLLAPEAEAFAGLLEGAWKGEGVDCVRKYRIWKVLFIECVFVGKVRWSLLSITDIAKYAVLKYEGATRVHGSR